MPQRVRRSVPLCHIDTGAGAGPKKRCRSSRVGEGVDSLSGGRRGRVGAVHELGLEGRSYSEEQASGWLVHGEIDTGWSVVWSRVVTLDVVEDSS